jgi:Ni/Fe-hydrogenase subunit HybB-like protein
MAKAPILSAGGQLHYMPSEEEQATVLGVVDIQNAKAISSVRAWAWRNSCLACNTRCRDVAVTLPMVFRRTFP